MAFGTGTMLGYYRLERLIGQGGMSDVYRAYDERSGAAVAVKFVRSADPQLARRLALEVKALERFEHPGLVRLLDSGIFEQQPYMVMELVEGPTLAQLLQGGPLTPAHTRRIGLRLADALAYVHSQGIVHRDVKPGNVLLDAAGDAHLADFGIARLVDTSTMTVTGTTLGTAAYMAPEQLDDHEVGPTADVWSLGAVLAECLTGQRLYPGSATEVMVRRLRSQVSVPAGVPGPWGSLLAQMLDHDPHRRPSGAQVFSALSSPALSSLGLDQSPVTAAAELTRPVWPLAAAGGAALAGAAVAGGTDARTWVDGALTPPAYVGAEPVTFPAPMRGLRPARSRRARAWAVLASAAVVAGVGGAALSLALDHKPGVSGGRAASGVTTKGGKGGRTAGSTGPGTVASSGAAKGTATTSTTTPTTTGTGAVATGAVAGALLKLDGDLAADVLAGSLDNGVARSVQSLAEKAALTASYGATAAASADLVSASGIVRSAVSNPGTARQLLQDLSSLSAALGAAPSAPGPAPPPADGHGHGDGFGHGHGHGQGQGQ
ncbi:MAG TPA: serine/threonine-protein kinase [Acidimicrobiales bacterium]|nr:serine/threonine-protein kinase [Acidimicrobiales bacterium]